jgi:pyruvate formate lyase activating enzyme
VTAGSAPARDLRIAGLVPLSTCDWPGRLVATVFCQGCPWSCTYCHNPALIPANAPGTVPWKDVATLLGRRRGLLDGVVFSGGEPTLQPAVVACVREVRDRGFGVGLHTSGASPRMLGRLVGSLDWVGLDIKATPRLYHRLTGSSRAADQAFASLRLLRDAGVAVEVRTTLAPELGDDDLAELADLLRAEQVTSVALQAASGPGGRRAPRRPGDLPERVLDRWRRYFPFLVLRESAEQPPQEQPEHHGAHDDPEDQGQDGEDTGGEEVSGGQRTRVPTGG